MIEVQALTKRYGTTTAVDGLSFTARPGTVTGFLGPNGAGKSTTMRVAVGLERPTAGAVMVDGRRYGDLTAPLRTLGVMLDGRAVHPGRSARCHLRALARTHGIPRSRVEEVLGLTGLEAVAGRRVRTFSLGMGQRLGVAAALLGDPATVMLDEPINGLDADGVLWVRGLVRQMADEGRTVLLSSHLMHELALCADRVVVIGRGRLLADATLAGLVESSGGAGLVRVRCTTPDLLARALRDAGAQVADQGTGVLHVQDVTVDEVGALAGRAGVVVLELAAEAGSLEQAYLALTADDVRYRSSTEQQATEQQAAAQTSGSTR